MQKKPSQIATDTADSLLAVFAGQTVTHEQIGTQLELTYAMAGKRTAVGSYFQVFDLIERAGVTSRYTGPNYTGDCLYTFPAVAA